jgi:hypothetical protein
MILAQNRRGGDYSPLDGKLQPPRRTPRYSTPAPQADRWRAFPPLFFSSTVGLWIKYLSHGKPNSLLIVRVVAAGRLDVCVPQRGHGGIKSGLKPLLLLWPWGNPN